MPKTRCPGQDTRYWTPESIFEVPCPRCGRAIEFFKDDLKRNCPGCGQAVVNPRNDMSCAGWCKSADECLAELGAAGPKKTQK